MNKKLSYFLKLSFSFGIIFYLIQKGDLNFKLLTQVNNPFLLVATGLLVLVLLAINNYRWSMILSSLNIYNNVFQIMKLSLIGLFFNFAVPSSIGGDVVKTMMLVKKQKDKKSQAITSVLIDRLIGLYGMLTLAFIALLLNFDMVLVKHDFQFLFIIVTSSLISMPVFVYLIAKKHQWLEQFMNIKFFSQIFKVLSNTKILVEKPKLFFKAYILTLFAQSCVILFFYVMSFVIGEEPFMFSAYMFAVPIGLIVMSVPLTPAGLGIGQVAFMILFKMHTGQESQLGQIAITYFQLIHFIFGLLGAYYYTQSKNIILKEETYE